MVIGVETAEQKRDGNPLIVKARLIAAAKNPFFVVFESKVDVTIGRQNDLMQGRLSLLTANQMERLFVLGSRLTFFFFVSAHHVDVQHADHFLERQGWEISVVSRANQPHFLGGKPDEQHAPFGTLGIECQRSGNRENGRRA